MARRAARRAHRTRRRDLGARNRGGRSRCAGQVHGRPCQPSYCPRRPASARARSSRRRRSRDDGERRGRGAGGTGHRRPVRRAARDKPVRAADLSAIMNDTPASRSTRGDSGPGATSTLQSLKNWLLRLRRRNGDSLRETIEELIEESETEGDAPITEAESALLRNIPAYDVMVPRADIVAVPSNIALNELVRIISTKGHSRVPVFRETLDDVIGMVHIKDVLTCLTGERSFDLKGILRELLFVAPSMRALDLLLQMRLSRIHMALVIDEFGGIDGLTTIEDVVEEIVGEIQ